MFLKDVPFYFLILALNEAFSYRLSPTVKQRNVQSASKQQQSKTDLQIPNPDVQIVSSRRPISLDLLVVVDTSSYRYHGDDTEHYIMNMLNVAASLWQSSSLPADVRVRIVKIHVLKEKHQSDLEVTDHANWSLMKFCQWQRQYFMTRDKERVHFDAAILVTRIDIQIGGNYDATGIAYNQGMCDLEYHCAICEDKSPMILSHTITHEIGHLLGMRHDGNQNTCPDRVFIMSGYATRGHQTFIWSTCSQKALAEFLSSNRARCLGDALSASRTPGVALDTNAMPGRIYDADYQCQMIYGATAKACKEQNKTKMCGMLKCQKDEKSSECVTDGRPALQGTSCGSLKWCLRAFCVQRTIRNHHDDDTAIAYRQNDQPTDGQYCNECSTFPYMDTPAPTTNQDGVPLEL